jgi:hypothetical protein
MCVHELRLVMSAVCLVCTRPCGRGVRMVHEGPHTLLCCGPIPSLPSRVSAPHSRQAFGAFTSGTPGSGGAKKAGDPFAPDSFNFPDDSFASGNAFPASGSAGAWVWEAPVELCVGVIV